MLHKSRRWFLAKAESPEDLAEKLTQHDWTGCTAFELQGYVFANDSTSGDGAKEYAVLRPEGESLFRQIESITFGWCSLDKALTYIRDIVAGKYDEGDSGFGAVELERFQNHTTCGHCA